MAGVYLEGNIQYLLAETRVTLIIQHTCPWLSEKNCTDYAEEERMLFNPAALSLLYLLCAGSVSLPEEDRRR